MISPVLRRTLPPPPISRQEILRYARSPEAGEETLLLLADVLEEAKEAFSYRVAFRPLPLFLSGDECRLGNVIWHSKSLSEALAGCKEAVVFAASVGFEIDRLITKYTRLSPAKALMLQAIGTERVEALCDAFCADLAREYGPLRSRFSPGYGDLPLLCQKDIFSLLDCPSTVGILLNESLLMSPSNSVTAIVGIQT